MNDKKKRICPVERAGGLDNKIRRLLQNPQKILKPYVEKGMTVLDVGCGPGFFSIDMAKMVGESGRVIASDLQEEMLQIVQNKIKGSEIENRIILHKCEEEKIGIFEQVDFVLLFYMVHEVLNKELFFNEIKTILRQNGTVLIVEPPFHVSNSEFKKMIKLAKDVGFTNIDTPKMLFHQTVVLQNKIS